MTAVADKLAQLNITVDRVAEGGAPITTVLLKDKRSHVFAITALRDTAIDLRLLSARLGLGKGGVQHVPESFQSALLHPPGTPLALGQSSASEVVSIVDAGISAQASVRMQAADGSDNSVTMSPADLEKFLRSLGTAVSYVDLSAAPKIDRGNPPDLKQLADSAAVVAAVKDVSAAAAHTTPPPAKPAAKSQQKQKSQQQASGTAQQPAALDLDVMVNTIVEKCFSAAAAEADKQDADSETRRTLLADLRMELNSLKNASYASGFAAARAALKAQLEASAL